MYLRQFIIFYLLCRKKNILLTSLAQTISLEDITHNTNNPLLKRTTQNYT